MAASRSLSGDGSVITGLLVLVFILPPPLWVPLQRMNRGFSLANLIQSIETVALAASIGRSGTDLECCCKVDTAARSFEASQP